MHKFPNYIQLDSKDCGPTCIQIIAKHYGKFLSLQDINEYSAVTKEGLSLHELGLTAERFGLKSLAIKAKLSNLLEDIPLPCVAHWKNKHYAVIYKVTKNHIYVSDPQLGYVKYSYQEFLKDWIKPSEENPDKGVLLLLEPTD